MTLRCWLFGHDDPVLERPENQLHVIRFRCPRCWAVTSETQYRPSPRLQRRIKIARSQSRLRLVKSERSA